MRISDWSSDVCSSDLRYPAFELESGGVPLGVLHRIGRGLGEGQPGLLARRIGDENFIVAIGRSRTVWIFDRGIVVAADGPRPAVVERLRINLPRRQRPRRLAAGIAGGLEAGDHGLAPLGVGRGFA